MCLFTQLSLTTLCPPPPHIVEIATLTRVGEGGAATTKITVLPASDVDARIQVFLKKEEERKKEEKAKEAERAKSAAASKTT